jgi:O-antigen ligase
VNFSTPIMISLGLLILWLTLVKPRVALFFFAFSLMAFNDYLGGHPSSIMEIGGNQFYAADFFLILLLGGLIRSILIKDLNSHIDKPIFIMMLLTVVVGIVAILIGVDNGHKSNVIIGDLRRYTYYPWAIFIPAMFLRNSKEFRGLECWTFWAAGVICAIAAYRIFTGSSYWPELHASEYGDFRGMNYHDYLILIFAICIAIGKMLNTKERPSLLHKVCLVVLPIFVIASNYRMAPLLMIACSSLVLLMLRRSWWGHGQMSLKPVSQFAFLGILLIALVCFAGAMTDNKIYLEVKTRIVQRVVQFDLSQQETYRVEMWKKLINQWEKSPLLGVGFGRKFEYQNQTPDGNWYWVSSQNFHNSYLELLLKSGILGLAVFLCLHLVILARCWRVFRLCPEEAPLIVAGIAFMIAVLVQAGLQPYLTEPNSIVLSYLIIGSVISLAYATPDHTGPTAQTPTHNRNIVSTSAV